MQHRQALGHGTTLFFQRTAVDRRVGAQQPEGDGIALQRLARARGQQLQGARVRRIEAHHLAIDDDQLLTQHLGNQCIHHPGQLCFLPAQEQLGLEERIQRFDMAQHFGAAELTMLSHQGG